MWLSVVLGGNPQDACPPKWKWNIFSPLLLWKNRLNVNISKTVTDTTIGSMEAGYETAPGLSIGTMTFDLG